MTTRRPFLLHHFLIDAAAHTPNAAALVEPKHTLDYGSLAARSNQIKNALVARGVHLDAADGGLVWSLNLKERFGSAGTDLRW